MGFSVIMLFFSLAFFSYSISDLSLAEESEELEDEENLWMINLDDYVVLTWVANTVEYLTALYLYVDDPYSATSVVLRYDSWLNALVLNSSIDANALGIWYNDFWEWVVWSVFVWWSGNKLYMNTIGILDEYWDWTGSRNWKNDSAVVIWWERNTAGQAWSVVVWWRDVSIGATQGLAVVWSDNVWVNNSAVTVVLWGKNVYFGAWAWHWFYAWYNLHWGYSNFLIWSWIDAQSAQHYSLNLGNTFAWSSAASWLAIKGWGLWWQRWFYVNSENGLWLNTSTPRLTFDARSWWPLKLKRSRWILDKEMVFTDDGSRILCDDEKQSGKFRWTVVYVQLLDDDNQFVTAWFCWCNGKAWTPLSNDTVTQYVCTNINSWDRKENCLGAEKLNNVIIHTGTEWYQRWDEEANGWSWDWIKLNWTFWWVPGLLSWMQRECVYSCKVWYHPDTKSPQGWFTWDCVPCTTIKNWTFISPWTWLDDCQFACNAWYKYNWWVAPNERANKWCAPCNYWEWTTWMNQSIMCERCEYPIWISARLKNSDWSPMKFYSWSMWDAVAKTWTWEPYFRGFTNFSRNWKYGCDFDCASWFIYSFGWSEWSNTCTECWTGTYSDWWKSTSCSSCRNKPMWSISFSWTDISWKFHSSQNNIIEEKDVAWYTSKWLTWAMSCEWTCNPTIWLVKVKEWDNWRCKCPEGTHLESLGGKAQCVSNKMDVVCAWELWEYAIRGPHIFTWAVWNGSWTNFAWEQKYWTYSDVDDPSKLKACEWTCPHWYQQDGDSNNCKPILLGKCSSINWTHISSDYNSSFWDSPSNLCAPGKYVAGANLHLTKVHINYYVGTDPADFQFYPTYSNAVNTNKAKYLITWTCEWFEYDPKFSASCYAYWDWQSDDGQCKNDVRSDGIAQAVCDTNFDNCNVYRSCPPIRDEKASADWHWKTWVCPWVFGWKKSWPCHSCDETYVWDASEGKCVSDKDKWRCEWWRPEDDPDTLEFWPEVYVIPFDEELDDYAPKTMPYTLVTWNVDLWPCTYKCKEWYVWQRKSAKCVPISRELSCEWDSSIEYAIYWKKTYRMVFSEITDDYVLDPLTFKKWFNPVVEKTNELWECEFICDDEHYWDELAWACLEYPDVIEYPLCWKVVDDCKDHDKDLDDCKQKRKSCNEDLNSALKCERDLELCENSCETAYNNCVAGCKGKENEESCIETCDTDYDEDECVEDNCIPCSYDSDDFDCDGDYSKCEENCRPCIPDTTKACTRWELSWEPERKGPNDYRWSCYTDKGWSLDCGGEEILYSCDTMTIQNAHTVGKRDKLTYQEYIDYPNKLYKVSEAWSKPCSFACNEWYSFIVNSDYPDWACVICKEWVVSLQIEYCTIMINGKCWEDEYYDKVKKKCFKMGNCYSNYWTVVNNSMPEHAYVPSYWNNNLYMRPFDDGDEAIRRQCYEDKSNVSPNTCSYTCEDWYYCTQSGDGSCSEWPFYCFQSHVNDASAYIYKNPTATSPKRANNFLFVDYTHVDWKFDSYEDFESSAISKYGSEWCYFACKSWYTFQDSPSRLAIWCYSTAELGAYECTNAPNVWWFIERTEKPKVKNQEWKWRDDYSAYEEIKADWCAATCQPQSRIVEKNWQKICLKNCPSDKYFNPWGFTLGWWCSDCPEWQVPDKVNNLLDWVPTQCMNACKQFWDDLVYDKKTGSCVWRWYSAEDCEDHGWYWGMVDWRLQCIIWVPEV